MYKRNFLLFLCTFLLLTTISFVSSAPPQTQVQEFPEGYEIVESQHQYLKTNEDYVYNFFLYNKSDGITIDDTNTYCTFYLANETGDVLFSNNASYTSYWSIEILGGNFSTAQTYSYRVSCQGDSGGSLSGIFVVTESGVEITEGRSILLIGLLTILVLMSFLSLYGVFKIENPSGKFALYWVTHILILIVCFVGWQFGVEGLLDGTGIVQVFRILFYVLTVAVFPMLILSIAWIFYIHTMNDDIRNMMEKGMSPEEAYRKSVNRRYF